jgi:hypothetical protein
MSIRAILSVLILGSSTAALAAPVGREHRAVEREHGHGRVEAPVVREHVRIERPVVRERARFERPVWREHERVERVERFERPIVREHWTRPYVYEQPTVYVAPQIYTAPMTPFVNGVMSISLGGVTGGAIELSANGGASFVEQVVIAYSDGRTQAVAVGRELDGGTPTLDLATDGSPVAAVTIYGSGSGVTANAV